MAVADLILGMVNIDLPHFRLFLLLQQKSDIRLATMPNPPQVSYILTGMWLACEGVVDIHFLRLHQQLHETQVMWCRQMSPMYLFLRHYNVACSLVGRTSHFCSENVSFALTWN